LEELKLKVIEDSFFFFFLPLRSFLPWVFSFGCAVVGFGFAPLFFKGGGFLVLDSGLSFVFWMWVRDSGFPFVFF
jgi:hypothetical protein